MTTAQHVGSPITWQKATASSTGGCVEVAATHDGGIAVRDSKQRDGAILYYTAHEWRCFLAGAKAGEFDALVYVQD